MDAPCSCAGFVPTKKKEADAPRPKVPWWTLDLFKVGRPGKRLGLTTEFRAALRSVYQEITQCPEYVVRLGHGCYEVSPETEERIARGEVDWQWFPGVETARTRWRPPPEMRAAMRARRP